ncbi:MAG TPA: thioredoxin [Bacteroidales bacterium]|nr:thioredoxin [Bacteroidales bacterium]
MKKIIVTVASLVMLVLSACNGNSSIAGGNSAGSTPGQVNKLTAESFRTLVWDYQANPNQWVFKGDLPVIIDFYADWCKPCKMVAPVLDELSTEYNGKIRVYKVNTDEQRELAGLFQINSIPAILFIPKDGKPRMSLGAMQKPDFIETIKSVLMVNPADGPSGK